jgi:hypothetical protein
LTELGGSLPAEGLSLGDFLVRLGERGPLMLCLGLTLPFLLPVSIPGSSTPFGFIIALCGIGFLTHRPPWVPMHLRARYVTTPVLLGLLRQSARLFARLEQWTRPRLLSLTMGRLSEALNGGLLVLGGLLLMAPLPLPFSNTLPAYGTLCLAMGILERDGVLVIAGYGLVLLTIGYFGLVAVLGGIGVKALLTYL